MSAHTLPVPLAAVISLWPRLLAIAALIGVSCTFTAYVTTDRTKADSQESNLPHAHTLLASLEASRKNQDLECIICKDEPEDAVQLACNHIFCRACLTCWLLAKKNAICPVCFRKVCQVVDQPSQACNILLCCWSTTGLLVAWAATHFMARSVLRFGVAVLLKSRVVFEVLVFYIVAMAFLDLAYHALTQRRELGIDWWKEVSRGDTMDSFMAAVSVVVAATTGYCYLTWKVV